MAIMLNHQRKCTKQLSRVNQKKDYATTIIRSKNKDLVSIETSSHVIV